MKIVNKLDYIYKKILHEAKSKINDIVEISNEEAIELGLINDDETEHDYSKDYFTIELLEDGYIECKYNGSGNYFEYSINNGNTWEELNQRKQGKITYITPEYPKNTKILIKGNRYPTVYNDTGSMGIARLNIPAKCNIYGNIMSLSYYDNFQNNNEVYSHMFYSLFEGSLFNKYSNIISAKNLILPNNLNKFCFAQMFQNCKLLAETPKLHSTYLKDGCYSNMFSGCISLIKAPELPATYLSNFPYYYMFSGCTSLTTAPELPATIMTTECYMGMFAGCISLTIAPELPATTLADSCYYSMFSGCTSLVKAPDLPAINLKSMCYKEMFMNCSSLNYIKCLAINIKDYLPSNYIISGVNDYPKICSSNWVNNVSLLGTFIKNSSMNDWPIGADSNEYYSGIPAGWTVKELDPDTGEIVNEYIAE